MKGLTIALASVALLVAGAVRADDGTNRPANGPRGPGGPGGPRLEAPLIPPRLMAQLALTADQKPKVDALASEFSQKRDQILANQKNNSTITELRNEMRAAWEARDREKMRALRAQLAPYDRPLLDLRRQYMDQVRLLLTDAQKKTLDSARQRFARRNGRPPAPNTTGESEAPPGD